MMFVLSGACQEPSVVEMLLSLDENLTQTVGIYAQPCTLWQRIVKAACMCLELSGHGVLWFTVTFVLLVLYAVTQEDLYLIYGANMLFLLLVDIVVVAPIKLVFKRPRPVVNMGDIPLSVSSVDVYAFPSGHASRCVALAAYFCYMPPFTLLTHLWYIWALLVSLSRVLLGRHHISDVAAGMLAGLFIFDLVRRSGLLLGL